MTDFRTGEQIFQDKPGASYCTIKKEGSQKLMDTSEKDGGAREKKKKKRVFTNQTKSET